MTKSKLFAGLSVIVFTLTLAACGTPESTKFNISALKGPTAIGMVNLADKPAFNFTVTTAPDEMAAKIVNKEVDIAAVPSALAATLYQKTNGGIQVIDINTMNVLYAVHTFDSTSDSPAASDEDFSDEAGFTIDNLEGQDVCSTGLGTTPQFLTELTLNAYGVDPSSVNMNYVSEPTDCMANLNSNGYAVIPEPFLTAARTKLANKEFDIVNLNDAYNAQTGEDLSFITGVTIARTEFINEHSDVVNLFLNEHATSTEQALSNLQTTAELTEKFGVVNADVAAIAIPNLNLVHISGAQMKADLTAFFSALGLNIPDDGFFYQG